MTISFVNDVCTLEQGIEFERLGIKQVSAYYWDNSLIGIVHISKINPSPVQVERYQGQKRFVPLFNTGELIAMLALADREEFNLTTTTEEIANILITRIQSGIGDIWLDYKVAEVNRRLDEFHKEK